MIWYYLLMSKRTRCSLTVIKQLVSYYMRRSDQPFKYCLPDYSLWRYWKLGGCSRGQRKFCAIAFLLNPSTTHHAAIVSRRRDSIVIWFWCRV